ncbi:MAG: AAA family ATPase [Pseudomonadota bacterium]
MIAEKNGNLAIVEDTFYGSHLTHAKEKPDVERWTRLKNRLADELARGLTIRRLAVEVGRPGKYCEPVTEDGITRWASDAEWGRELSRYVDDGSSYAAKLDAAIEAFFARLDEERANAPFTRPGMVETSVTTRIIEGIARARRKSCPVVIEAPSGCGKTAAIEEYTARTRKEEGFGCPVWRIELSPTTLKMKPVLALMLLTAQGLDPAENWNVTDPEHVLAWKLKGVTEGRGGIFIIDEAQGLGDDKNDQALHIFNELRSFTDKHLFGLAFMDNGEIFRRFKGGKFTQLASRIEARREVIDSPTEDDVDLIMRASGTADIRVNIGLSAQTRSV